MGPNREESHALVTALSPHLPAGWRADLSNDPDRYWAELVRDADGARVHVAVGGYRFEGRVVFRGCWPKFRDGTPYYGSSSGSSVSITCNAKRPAKTLAQDFARRFLPEFDVEYAKARAYVLERDTQCIEAEAVAQRLAQAIDAEIYDNKIRRGDGVHLRTIGGGDDGIRRLIVQPAYGGVYPNPVRVNFEIHDLDPETAAEALALVRASKAKRPEHARVQEVRARVLVEEDEELVVDNTLPTESRSCR